VDYGSRNVLADPDLRSGIKDFSSWPTVPQARPPLALGHSLDLHTHKKHALSTLPA